MMGLPILAMSEFGRVCEKNKFGREIERVRKAEQARDKMVKDVNVQILRDGIEMRRRRAEYFKQVLNVIDVRQANINAVADGGCQCSENLQLAMADANVGRI